MQRIIQGQSATLRYTFYVDGVPTDPSPDTATVTITRDDGTDVVTASAATEAGTGVVTFAVTPLMTVDLDRWTVGWTATVGGQSQTFTEIVEVAGGVLFTLAQARAMLPLNNTVTYTSAMVLEARTMVESALEDACGVAFVPRYDRRVFSGSGRTTMLLPPRTRAIRLVSDDGTDIGISGLASMRFLPTGELYYPSVWSWGYGNLEIAFEHGYDYPPPRVSQAALLWCKNFLVKGPVDDRMTSIVSEDGTFALSTPGMRGAMVGIPEVDAVIQQYSMVVGIA
jgi:hypothetical protein